MFDMTCDYKQGGNRNMLQKTLKKTTALFIVVVLALTLGVTVFASNNGTGNYSVATAINLGRWSTTISVPVTILPDNQNEAFYSFTASAGDRFYIRIGAITGSSSEGMRLQLMNSAGTAEVRMDGGVVDRGTITAFRYVTYEVPPTTPANTRFIIRISRNPNDPASTGNQRVFTPSFRNLFQNGSGTFNFSGTASNPGNTQLDIVNGRNSSELRLDLTNNSNIPVEASVRSVTTKSTMSPSQGNVRHHIANNGAWYVATVNSATSGNYGITINNGLAARTVWTFRYNVLATAASTMSNVSITINYEYNVSLPYRARLS